MINVSDAFIGSDIGHIVVPQPKFTVASHVLEFTTPISALSTKKKRNGVIPIRTPADLICGVFLFHGKTVNYHEFVLLHREHTQPLKNVISHPLRDPPANPLHLEACPNSEYTEKSMQRTVTSW